MLRKFFRLSARLLALSCLISLTNCISGSGLIPMQAYSPEDWANSCTNWDDWDKQGSPFRIYGNSYYVGTCGISSILVTGKDGHILIDGGTEAGADLIAQNIKDLGFSLKDVKFLLHSHEHFDHVAGLAKLQKQSGAKLLASMEAAPVLATGITADLDPQAGMHEPFPAARVDGIVKDGELVNLDGLVLTAITTPGHTLGALSWQWESCEKDQCLSIVYADSLSPISRDTYRFSDHLTYVNAYQRGLVKLAGLDCQILLAPHPSAGQMRERLLSPDGLIDPESCAVYAENVENKLNKRLFNEQKEIAP